MTAIAAIVALLGTLLMPRSYYSEARLFVRFGRENQVDPTASGGQMVSLYESRESEINSLIEILKSRATTYESVEDFERAEANYNALVEVEPINPAVYADRGYFYMRQSRFDAAMRDFVACPGLSRELNRATTRCLIRSS